MLGTGPLLGQALQNSWDMPTLGTGPPKCLGQATKFQQDTGSKSNADPAAELLGATKRENNLVQRDYVNNKTVQFVCGKVLDVPIGLTDTQKQALKMGMV